MNEARRPRPPTAPRVMSLMIATCLHCSLIFPLLFHVYSVSVPYALPHVHSVAGACADLLRSCTYNTVDDTSLYSVGPIMVRYRKIPRSP